MTLTIGSIVTVTATGKHDPAFTQGKDYAFYIRDAEVHELLSLCIEDGSLTVREATHDEKELCYWSYELTDKEGCELSNLDTWKELRHNYVKQ